MLHFGGRCPILREYYLQAGISLVCLKGHDTALRSAASMCDGTNGSIIAGSMVHIFCCKVGPLVQGSAMQYSMLMNQTLCKCSDSGTEQSFCGQERHTHTSEYVKISVKMNCCLFWGEGDPE